MDSINTHIIDDICSRYCMLADKERPMLSALLRPVSFDKHEIIISEGEIASTIYFIEKGMSHAYIMKKGQSLSLQFDYEGHFIIALESFLTEKPSEQTIAALEPMKCYAIDKKEFEQVARNNVNFQLLLRKIIEYSILRLTRYSRLLRNECAKHRYQIMCDYHPEVIRRAPLIFIASLLHMTPETLSRVRSAQLKCNETTTDNISETP